MASKPPPAIRHCPVCGTSMLGSKSNESCPEFDTYSCLKCETVITSAPRPGKPEHNR
jgi:hypothetical protein